MVERFNNKDGSLLCARYAFMPNKLRYCGGDKNSLLYQYTSSFYQDPGLNELLEEFETLYPYLKLIAYKNKIINPFDERVVEAYWIGNGLLKNIQAKDLFSHIVDVQKLKKKLKPDILDKVIGILPSGAFPHHSFHVINIPKRTGYYPVNHTIETMDKCRIGWGKVIMVKKFKLRVLTRLLEIKNNKIGWGEAIEKEYIWQLGNKGFIKNIKKGDWVSLHWDFVCDRISKIQLQNLKYYTQLSINLANKQING